MIRINLLPHAERQSKWPVNRLLVVAGCLISLTCSSLYSYSLFQIWTLDNKLQATRTQSQLLQPMRIAMNNANNKQQLLTKKNTLLATITNEHSSLYAMIEHVTKVSSSQIKFTDIAKNDKGFVVIKGWALSYPDIAEFIQTMEKDQFMLESALTSVEQKANAEVTTFELAVKPRGI